MYSVLAYLYCLYIQYVHTVHTTRLLCAVITLERRRHGQICLKRAVFPHCAVSALLDAGAPLQGQQLLPGQPRGPQTTRVASWSWSSRGGLAGQGKCAVCHWTGTACVPVRPFSWTPQDSFRLVMALSWRWCCLGTVGHGVAPRFPPRRRGGGALRRSCGLWPHRWGPPTRSELSWDCGADRHGPRQGQKQG